MIYVLLALLLALLLVKFFVNLTFEILDAKEESVALFDTYINPMKEREVKVHMVFERSNRPVLRPQNRVRQKRIVLPFHDEFYAWRANVMEYDKLKNRLRTS